MLLRTLQRAARVATMVLPFAVIGALLYAGIFVKPKSSGDSVPAPVLGGRDAFYGVASPTPSVLWAVGRGGKIVRSDDSGKTWQAQTSGTHANLQSIVAWDAARAVAVGNNATVLATEDSGRTWRAVTGLPKDSEGHKLLRARVGGDGQAFVVGEFGTILMTVDAGRTWVSLGAKQDVAWNDIAVSKDTVVAVGEFGKIRRSVDGGRNWADVPSPVQRSLSAVHIAPDGTAVAVGLEGALLVSGDGGSTWRSVESGTQDHLYGVLRPPGGDWVAVGDKGVIVRKTGEVWRSGRVAEDSYAWFTEVQGRGTDLVLGGAQLAVLGADGKFQAFR